MRFPHISGLFDPLVVAAGCMLGLVVVAIIIAVTG